MCSEPAIAHTQRHSSRKIPASADTSSPQKGLIRPGGTRVSQKGAIMVAIRKTKAKEEFGPDPSLDLPQGAHLKVTSSKLFAPKFHEETGDLWGSKVSLKQKVVDDRTEDGDADGLEFFDSFDLKFDEDVANKFRIGPDDGAKDNDGKKLTLDKFLKYAKESDFT